ncbi:GAF domain-containing protein [Calidifontibacter sp. DB0510]|uniref:GAF domain-containing protein n=1 Tax=Metallococcus carri TaxID=1656884 RepID=A0A967EFH5_9MICO|nr:GAF domain-containing protein [Metallococcus carri]NHN56626.1 GAF domain-containing protein [Metallococcus carri]NOP38925.1 GAF domain-containing protein [Calidifontibacter sp. DB2511S]
MKHAVRPLVTASWMRSSAAGVRREEVEAPVVFDPDALREHRAQHPLWRALPVLQDVVGQAAERCDALMAVADELGQLLFVQGSRSALRQAEGIGFVEGSTWDERLAGTNAPGTALALGRPVEVFGAEHFRESVHRWSCAAVPIRDLRTGGIVGAVDVTGGDAIAVPQTMAMLRAAARLAEWELVRADAGFALADPPPSGTELTGLGADALTVRGGGRHTVLSPRHSEIVAVLTEHPDGLRGDEIACQLYESDGGESTVRAELIRLRKVLGDDVLGSRPYRLTVQVATDWSAVEAMVAVGDVAGAVRAYPGPLLPHSMAPGVVEIRDRVHAALSRAVATSCRPDLLATWTRSEWGADDLGAWRALAGLASGPMRTLAATHLRRLDQAARST